MNILKITQKIYHEIIVDENDTVNDLGLYYIRIDSIWYNRNKDGSLYQVNKSLSKYLEEQFYDMNGVMHEQLDLYENDNSGHPNNHRPIRAYQSTGQVWLGTNPYSLRDG